jgi:hypothetical protein
MRIRLMRKMSSGYEKLLVLVNWKYGAKQWIPVSILKESNPVEEAEYAKAREIDTEPAFAWWVPYTLRKRTAIVSAVKARARKITHKYGIEIPRNVDHAHKLTRRMATHYGEII